MPEIVAANNLTIQHDTVRWTLYGGQSANGSMGVSILSAASDGLRYPPQLAEARRLPTSGQLRPDQCDMVVVGWAAEDSSWHLGLMLNSEVAQTRGGRWCGLARWDAADGTLAQQAGRALANVIHRPFQFVPPTGEPSTEAPQTAVLDEYEDESSEESVDAPIRERVHVELLPLPIDLGEWVLEDEDPGLRLEHTKEWSQALLLRTLFFGLLTPIFGALSIGALITPYAGVQPQWLPLLGLVITIGLLAGVFLQLRTLISRGIVVIDPRSRMVRIQAGRGRRVTTQSPFEGLQYVLISHVVSRQKARPVGAGLPTGPEKNANVVYNFAAEMWIHVFSPRRGFIELCHLNDIEGRMLGKMNSSEKRELDLTAVNTPAHHAAARIGEILGLPVYTEAR